MKAGSPPESCSFATIFSHPSRWERAFPLMSDPLVGKINRSYESWRAAAPMARARGLDSEDVWCAVKVLRMSGRRKVPLIRTEGGEFGYTETPSISESLHRIDQSLGGGGPAALESGEGMVSDPMMRRRFAIRSMMEEAIESSRIEGAVTTRNDALDLLRSGREPKTEHERMVVNNYVAMQDIKTWLDRDLTIERLHNLQTILTEKTLVDPAQAGRFRRSTDNVRIVDDRTNETVFTPPPAGGLPDRVRAICDFANRKHTGDEFIHPIVKACILHFLIGYEHPWCDGNGRTARAIFYWFVLKHGYTVFEYMAVSELIRKSWGQYAEAYLNTENDDGDLTYFIYYKLRIIVRAIDQLGEHLEREEAKVRRGLQLAADDPSLNLRQRLLLEHAIRHPRTVYTVKSHATSNRITAHTARSDLDGLVQRRLLSPYKAGRMISYVLAPDAQDRLTGKVKPAAPRRRPRKSVST